jgi:hypothetical protein
MPEIDPSMNSLGFAGGCFLLYQTYITAFSLMPGLIVNSIL